LYWLGYVEPKEGVTLASWLPFAALRWFGVPAHPFVVHAVVVLVPLSALAFVALMWRERWRERYLLPITLLALGGAIAAFLAKQTGESLQEVMRPTGERLGEHPEQGDMAFLASALYGCACLATYLVYEYGYQLRERFTKEDRFRLPVSDEMAAYLLTVPIAVIAIGLLVMAGHSGARLVWSDRP
jgi:hypothetical protein